MSGEAKIPDRIFLPPAAFVGFSKYLSIYGEEQVCVGDDFVEYVRADLLQEWNSNIEEAPKDGTEVDLIVRGERHTNIYWDGTHWNDGCLTLQELQEDPCEPSHWRHITLPYETTT